MKRFIGLLAVALIAALFFALSPTPSADADIVYLKKGGRLEGRILKEDDTEVTILTYKDGPVTVPRSNVKSTRKYKNKYDWYDEELAKIEVTADGHFAFGTECKKKKLLWSAKKHWEKAIALDTDHAGARKSLKHKQVDGAWQTYEEQQLAKGLELYEGKWLKPAKIAEIKQKILARTTHGWVLTASFDGNVDDKYLQQFADRAVAASEYMWTLTNGQIYVKQITVTEGGGQADFHIKPGVKDDIKIGGGAYARTGPGGIDAPGKILTYTFFHELIHWKYGRGPHCTNCKHCIMSSDPTADQICTDANHKAPPNTSCWAAIKAKHKDKKLKPLGHDPRKVKLPPVPETKVVLKSK